MARQARLNLPNIPQHVVQRGNNRRACFFLEQDYKVYLDKLREYASKYQVAVHAYVLMTNHVHLLMTPSTEKGVSQLMQSLGRYYVRYVNHTYERTGTLWEGRFRSSLVGCTTYFLLVSRYIELNPLRANMVDHPASYPWSSYHHNALDKHIQLISPHPIYLALGATSLQRKVAYQALFETQIPELSLQKIRNATIKTRILGDEGFKQKIEEQLGRSIEILDHGGDRKSDAFKVQQL